MPTDPTRAPGSPPEASDGRRLHIHGIKEMPAGYDAEVAELFRDLRAASNLSEVELAASLATRPEVVQALEQGALYALPPWPETSRVVNSYGLLLNLDVRPLLRRIYAQIEPNAAAQAQDPYAVAAPRPEPQAPPSRSPLDIPFEAEQRVTPPQPYHEPARAPQQNWAPPPVDRRMQPRPPGAPMAGRQMPQMPQQQPPRPPQPNAPQVRALQAPQARSGQNQPQPQMRAPQAPPPRQQPIQQPNPASATVAPPSEAKKPAPKKGWLGQYLKWGVAALVLIGAACGLFFVLNSGTSLVGTSSPSQSGEKAGKPADPDDPRSHKSDRLPSPGLQ
jgi:hypothetical protein